MIPVAFADCRGWLHEADGPLGVVVCGSHGFDELCAHRGLTLLADSLAAAGLPTLRYDLPGTGDSSGTDLDDDLVAAWLASLRDAIATLRALTGRERVALVGLRLGALLAVRIAAEQDVDLLCALAPPVSARAYVRELKVTGRLMEVDGYALDPRTIPEGAVAVCGFVTTAETASAILDLDGSPPATAGDGAEALVLLPDDVPSGDGLVAELAGAGWHVGSSTFRGYADLMCEPTASRVPEEAWKDVVGWLAARAARADGALVTSRSTADALPVGAQLDGDGWCEEGVVLASPCRLVGVLCRPAGEAEPGQLVLLGSAGGTHHIGWARQTVDLARHLAKRGIATFRFDFPGTGASEDDPARRGSPYYAKNGAQDIAAVLDFTDERGYGECAGLGVCSGAYQLFHAARDDRRLRRLVLVNLQCFEWTPRFRVDLKSWQLTRSQVLAERRAVEEASGGAVTPWWLELARRGGRRVVRLGHAAVPSGPTARQRREVDAALTDIAEGGCSMLLVYSSDDAGLVELEDHFGPVGERAVADGRARVELVSDADHTLTQVGARARLQRIVAEFLLSGAEPVGGASRTPSIVSRSSA